MQTIINILAILGAIFLILLILIVVSCCNVAGKKSTDEKFDLCRDCDDKGKIIELINCSEMIFVDLLVSNNVAACEKEIRKWLKMLKA